MKLKNGIGAMKIWSHTLLLTIALAVNASAYTVITVSTGTPVAVEKALIAQTTTQFNASLFVNPFAANTYSVKLFGFNPKYNPPPTSEELLRSSIQFEYASGMIFERNKDANMIGYFMGLCDNATTFSLVKIDSTTCQGVLGFMDNWIVTQTSGIAVLPDPLKGL